MELSEFVQQVEGFDSLTPKEKIKIFAWFLHVHKSTAAFDNEMMRNCFKQLHINTPDVSVYLPRMASSKPAELLKERSRYRLARASRSELDKKYGNHQSVIQVARLLSELPDMVPDIAERAFLREALNCYRVEAFRACIVMTWNLAFDHVLRWILADSARLSNFNSAIGRRFPKKAGFQISMLEHFEELKESETIEVCQTAALFSKNITEILREKLKKRNMAAHPSQIVIQQSQADDVVTDLVSNVIVVLS
ncbi:hypothetical protein G6L16_006675 [Agrobacterium tumefaciens]|uniref:hypothetical protein n=1 Tax=Agrobacterium tumefaciens TaxID=358 RepID=UPI001573CB9D|nr:hypothetical protein [Agrobacterium tumefaciens]NSZ63021.1 hypothetical protein [Agrobacterium tumefaciens]NTA69391.1 hypothetical protein [Agrobacterium tumefaciens]WIE39184.1 hypothetical protein G6L16_006675 [Agrobacterium tumefaciens]